MTDVIIHTIDGRRHGVKLDAVDVLLDFIRSDDDWLALNRLEGTLYIPREAVASIEIKEGGVDR